MGEEDGEADEGGVVGDEDGVGDAPVVPDVQDAAISHAAITVRASRLIQPCILAATIV